MSAIVRCKSKMTMKKFLLKALDKISVPQDMLNVLEEHVTISRKYHGGYRGVTYQKVKDTYMCVYDEDDLCALNAKVDGKTFTGEVEQWYNALVVKDTLKKMGYAPTVKRVDNRIRVQAMA